MNSTTRYFLSLVFVLCAGTTFCTAQGITYMHDEAKMNQITVMETGGGTLTPEFYYWLFHDQYKTDANITNKQSFRTAASISGYNQVEYADTIKSALEKRAEIEALNIADRTGGVTDLAWTAEKDKIESKMQSFMNNINRVTSAGGSTADKHRWEEYYNIYQCAITATQDAYMPNAQRKKEYLAIYNDVCKQNELLLKHIVQLQTSSKTASLLFARNERVSNLSQHAKAAHERWKNNSKLDNKQ